LGSFTSGTTGDSVVAGDGGIVTARTAVVEAQTALNEALVRRGTLASQLASTPATLDVNSPAPVVIGGGQNAPTNKRTQLAMARSKLEEMRTHYTDDYPDIVDLKKLISHLQASIASAPQSGEYSDTQGIANPAYLMIRTKLTDEDTNVALARSRLSDAQKRLADATQMATSGLSIQRQYEDLDRDYDVLHKEYLGLVERREAAKISQAVGDQQSSFVFRVVDPPRKPDRPTSPNRILFNFLVLIAGLGAGGGVALTMNQFSGKFMTLEQLSQAFSLPVVGTVTVVRGAVEAAQAKREATIFGAWVGALLLSYIIVFIMFHTGVQSVTGVKL
jgi:uncharacterized protein involved in exopolysaccharide biosynthesis